MFEKVSDETLKKFSFKNKTIIKTSEEMQLLNSGVQIPFKPGQIIIMVDWKD